MTEIPEHLRRRSDKARADAGLPPIGGPAIRPYLSDRYDPLFSRTFGDVSDREHWWQKPFLACEVGSTAHGTGVEGKEDLDIMGIALEPMADALLHDLRRGTHVYRPGRGPEDPSGPGDLDLTVHSLRKWAVLAMGGNPSILLMLFAPMREVTGIGRELRDRFAGTFRTRATAASFLGYAESQRQRLIGERGGHMPRRPDLVAEHGYDTKYASHLIRLGIQGLEYCIGGTITMPMKEGDRAYIQAIRRGEIPLDEVLEVSRRNEALLETLKEHLGNGDFDKFRIWVAETYRSYTH